MLASYQIATSCGETHTPLLSPHTALVLLHSFSLVIVAALSKILLGSSIHLGHIAFALTYFALLFMHWISA